MMHGGGQSHSYRWRTYGITRPQYDKLVIDANGVCQICGAERSGKRVLSIDHDHKTGAVRGLLCSRCNGCVGVLEQEDRQKFEDYLERTKNVDYRKS